MKRFLLTGLVLVGLGVSSAFAQSDDDIYYNSKDAKKDAKQYTEATRPSSQSQERYDDGSNNSNRYQDNSNTVSTDENGEYSEYDSDDYSYSGSIRRFNNPMYGMGYYGGWYDPWGWNYPYGWGYTPGWSIGIGYGGGFGYGGFGGGPYWSSGWGYNAWYGYPGFNSYWGSPYCGYGGMGYGYGGYGGGYWNGYYAGYYGGGSSYMAANRPRYSTNGLRNNGGVINRSSMGGYTNSPRPGGFRSTNGVTTPTRGNSVQNSNNGRGGTVNFENNNGNPRGRGNAQQIDRPTRGSFSSSEGGNISNGNGRPQRAETYNNGGIRSNNQGGGRPQREMNSNNGGNRPQRMENNNSGGGRSMNQGNNGGSMRSSGGNSGGGRSFGGSSGGGGGRR